MSKRKPKTPMDEIVELLGKIEKAEEAVESAALEWDSKKEEAKTAKGVWMTKVSELRDLCRTRKRWAAEAKKQPLLNQVEAKPAETATGAETQVSSSGDLVELSPKAWRKWPTSTLAEYGLPAGKVKLLEESGLSTMGKLMDAMNKKGKEDFWWKDIKGLGETGYDALTEAIAKLRKARSDFQADAA